jgi:hypothetical protein
MIFLAQIPLILLVLNWVVWEFIQLRKVSKRLRRQIPQRTFTQKADCRANDSDNNVLENPVVEMAVQASGHIELVKLQVWRRRFPKGSFWPVSRSSEDRYWRSVEGPLIFGDRVALAVVGFERANATPSFFE